MRSIGIDFGLKRIGVAVSSPDGTLAFPLEVLPSDDRVFDQLYKLAHEYETTLFVVGDPGSQNQLHNEVVSFVRRLESDGYRVVLEKEFMTSLHVDMFTTTKPVARKTKQDISPKRDDSAAALILQRYLDRVKHSVS